MTHKMDKDKSHVKRKHQRREEITRRFRVIEQELDTLDLKSTTTHYPKRTTPWTGVPYWSEKTLTTSSRLGD